MERKWFVLIIGVLLIVVMLLALQLYFNKLYIDELRCVIVNFVNEGCLECQSVVCHG